MSRDVSTRSGIPPFHVMAVMGMAAERAAHGADVFHLEVGEPPTPAPSAAIAAAREAIERDRLGYTPATGDPGLRRRIARHYLDVYGTHVDPSRVIVTLGGSGACILAFLACFDEGARVGVIVPGYPCYRNMLTAFGVNVIPVRVDAGAHWLLSEETLEGSGDLDGLVVASPSNPTGTMLGREDLEAVSAWCEAQDVRLIVDEIYHGIVYGEPAGTALAVDDEIVVVNSFSKYYSMTGWRVGWMVVPEYLVDPIERLAQNLFVAPSTLAQRAAEKAMDCTAELDAHVERYRRNRELLLDRLPRMGITDLSPADGAFFVYADVGHLTDDSYVLCRSWLDDLGVAVTPGIDFDPEHGRSSVRFSFAGTRLDVEVALERLEGRYGTS